jgi:hypothetical protein
MSNGFGTCQRRTVIERTRVVALSPMLMLVLTLVCIQPAWGQPFIDAPEYAAGHSPHSVAGGDFNGRVPHTSRILRCVGSVTTGMRRDHKQTPLVATLPICPKRYYPDPRVD